METTAPMTETTTGTSVLPEGLALPGPCVIGATGGSGTRVVARIVRTSGLYTGEKLNPYEDAVELGFYSDRWIDRYVEAGGDVSAETRGEMESDLRGVLADHLSTVPDGAAAWGWKEPRSIYLERFWDESMPGFRFLHFLRDGRDMAFSENQNQLTKHGPAVLGDELRKAKTHTRSIALWNRVNLAAADYGERVLGSRYLRVRFEDLCAEPEPTIAAVLGFFGLEGDAEAAAAEVRPPDSLGRWQLRRRKVIDEITETARPALGRFGYL
jgi:Sulfotransferase family